MPGPAVIGSVCVYCGSSAGTDVRYREAARGLGGLLAAAGVRLVYGGGAVGLMGELADAVLGAGGEVVGVLPRGLFSREVAHGGLTELHEVATMHERKQLMFELSDAFVALPGGLGTLEELAEITTWAQLGIHRRPIAVVDVAGYWQPLRRLFERATHDGFLVPTSRDLVVWVDGVDQVLEALGSYRPPPAEGTLTPGEV
ncbi:MAG: TIGR00730 family Rossman fold protein [Actinomycetota bacterium]